MLNESKVKLMTRMAMYESKQGEEDFPSVHPKKQ